MGIATHFGIVADHSALGCAKSLLTGRYEEPGAQKGSYSDLIAANGDKIGEVLRTKDKTNRVFVSPGNLITGEECRELMLRCATKYRIPEPTRMAHLLINEGPNTPGPRQRSITFAIMRAALAILLLTLLSHQSLLKLGIVAWYEWNRDYVAQTLCENRDRPQLKCCGKCYLRKQLAKADATSKSERPLMAQLAKLKLPPFVVPEPLVVGAAFMNEARQDFGYKEPFAEEVPLAVIQPPG